MKWTPFLSWHILVLPDPWEIMPRSSTTARGLDNKKELRPRGPSSMLQLSSIIKDAFDKIFRLLIYLRVNTSNHLIPLQSGARWDSLVIRTKSRS